MSESKKNNGAPNEAFVKDLRKLARQLGKHGAHSKRSKAILELLKMTADFGHTHAQLLKLEQGTDGRDEQVQALRVIQALPIVYSSLAMMILRGTPPPEEDDPNFGHYKFCIALYSFCATALKGGLANVLSKLPDKEEDDLDALFDEDSEDELDYLNRVKTDEASS